MIADTLPAPDASAVGLDETTSRQRRATNPAASAWVSANAGSGKTHVLAHRVVRLLLSGVDPAKILCITFTRAAAAEMAGRVHALLGEWVTLPDAALASRLAGVEGAPPSDEKQRLARTLFARALETPGGLRIQTIHGFCESILQRFPLEAGVPAGFAVMDDASARDVIGESERSALLSATASPGSPLGQACRELIAHFSDSGRAAALGSLIASRGVFERFLAEAGGLDAALAELAGTFAVGVDQSEEDVFRTLPFQGPFTAAMAEALVSLLKDAGPKDQKLAERIKAALAAGEGDAAARFGLFRDLFLTKDQPRKWSGFVSRATRERMPALEDVFGRECERLLAALDLIARCRTFRATGALLTFGHEILTGYRERKARLSSLDYADLIDATARLLTSGPASAWVRYKLDGGFDHVLVDEAQDTSPGQWAIISALCDDFFAGASARSPGRTVFAVGDVKQSIYSFQGAEPAGFVRQGGSFARRAGAVGAAWDHIELQLSFRSTPDVLGAVDAVFQQPGMVEAVAGEGNYAGHSAIRFADPGSVELWPLEAVVDEVDPEDWAAPIDELPRQSPEARLAARIADALGGWFASGDRLEGTGEPLAPGDVLVLVRKRDGFVECLTRTLKSRGIAVAGADRLALAEHIVIRDLMALAQVALYPADDLSLASVLRGPLFDVSEDELFTLATGRAGTLRDELSRAAASSPRLERLNDRLSAWLGRADRAPPFEFFARLLGPDGGRAAFAGWHGVEAEDILDEFLSLALDYERMTDTPTLQGFLQHVPAGAGEIKREPQLDRDEVRIMTVHGAKGLEAPVVFLVDPGSAAFHASHRSLLKVYDRGEGRAPGLFWRQGKPHVTQLQVRLEQAEQQRAEAEYRRLLYVGMTRARDRLIVCGYQGKTGADDGCWHRLVEQGLGADAQAIEGQEGEQRLRWTAPGARLPRPPKQRASASDSDSAGPDAEGMASPVAPDWLHRPPPRSVDPLEITPTGGAATLFDDAEPPGQAEPGARAPGGGPAASQATAIEYGRYVHALLEHLPGRDAAGWTEAALKAAMAFDRLGPEDRQRGLEAVQRVLTDPACAAVFRPGSRAEVALVGELMDGNGRTVRVSGRVDRLVVDEARALIVDYKTGRPPGNKGDPEAPEITEAPEIPEAYVRQLGLYRLLLGAMLVGKPIQAAIVWTAVPRLQMVPESRMDSLCAGLSVAGPLAPPGAEERAP